MRRVVLVLLPLLFALSACGGPRPRPWGSLLIPPGAPIPLGIAADASGMQGLQRTAESAASAVGTVDGHPLAVTQLPVGCSGADPQAAAPPAAVVQAVAGVIGPLCSTACVYSEGVLYAQRVTMITPSCTAAAVVQQGFPIAFRLAWDDNDQALLAARYALQTLRSRRAALIGDGTVYATSLTNVFKDVFRGGGGSVVATSTLSPGGTAPATLGRALAAKRPEVVFMALSGPSSAAAALTELRRSLPGVPLMTADTILGQDPACAEGDASQFALPTALSNLYVATGLARIDGQWNSELDAPAAPACDGFQAQVSDAVQLYARAIAKVAHRNRDGSLAIPRQALRDAIAREQLRGRSGKTAFDPFGDRLTDVGAALYRDDTGRAVEVKRLEH